MVQSERMVFEKIRELGGKIEGGMAWTWASFPSDQAAEAFSQWLGGEWEQRGVYKSQGETPAGVRFR